MAATALTRALDELRVHYELLPHPRTETAAEEAKALAVAPEGVAKTLVVTAPTGYVRAVVPASERLDLHKVRELLGASGKLVHLAREEDLARDFAEFELGAVPPLGGRADPLVVDRRLAEQEQIVFEAGSHDESIRLRTTDLVEATGARVIDVCED